MLIKIISMLQTKINAGWNKLNAHLAWVGCLSFELQK